MWVGYLKKDEAVKRFWEKNDVRIVQIHTSGHAYLQDLVKFSGTIKPKNIIPIHTEHADMFEEYFGKKVVLLKDGERLRI
jgi:ribonuclease J